MIDNSLEALLADGFTRRSAVAYLGQLEDERKSGLFDADALEWAHAHGFTANAVALGGIDEGNWEQYLSDYDYARLFPLNSWQRIWINDKLTLKYMLAGTELDRYLPAYYYYTRPEGLLPLAESHGDTSVQGFAALLREVGEMACKPCNGARAKGFFKLSATEDGMFLNEDSIGEAELAEFLSTHPNYVFTGFMRPCAELAKVDPVIHTLRILSINPTGVDPTPIASYLRFSVGADKSGSKANYEDPTDEKYSFNCYVDVETGEISRGRLAYANRVVPTTAHPDSGVEVSGIVPHWNEIRAMIRDVALRLPAIEYLGYDIGITEDGPQLMEINSGSGIAYLQLFTPLMAEGPAGDYFRSKLAAIDALTPDQIRARNAVVR